MKRASSAVKVQRKPRDTLPFKSVLVQLVLGIVIVVLTALLVSRSAAESAMWGGIVSIVPALYFALRFLQAYSSKGAARSVGVLYRAEAGKFGLTVVLFLVVFILVPPSNPAFFFFAYIAITLVQWLVPWLLTRVFRCRI